MAIHRALPTVFFLLVLAWLGAAAEVQPFVATLPEGGQLSMMVPSGWKASTAPAGPSITIELSPGGTGDFVVLLTLLPIQPDSILSKPEDLRALVLETGNRKLPTALQERIELTEIRGDQAFGFLYHLTDRNPEKGPGDYREAHQGMILIGQYAASVTILTHSDDLETVELAKKALESAKVGSAS